MGSALSSIEYGIDFDLAFFYFTDAAQELHFFKLQLI